MSPDTDLRGRLMACRMHAIATPLALTIAAGAAWADTRLASGALHGIGGVVRANAGVVPARQITFTVNDVEGVAGQEMPVDINMAQPAEPGSDPDQLGAFILIRNIPAGVRLNAGMASGRLWVLPLHDVEGLRLIADPSVVGKFVLEFNLIGTDNKPLAQQNVGLNLLSADTASKVPVTKTLAVQEGVARGRDAQPPPRPRPSQTVSPEEAVLLERGEELLRQGGLVAARIIFEELARKGSTKGALALARSFDPAHIGEQRGSGLGPDIKKALEWYRRAEEMGSPEAKARLAEINSRR
jgi:hypothetical protein